MSLALLDTSTKDEPGEPEDGHGRWPHPAHFAPMLGDHDLLDALASWILDASMLQRMLTSNPCALYGFDPHTSTR